MSGINMKNSPNWFNIISDTTDFVISDMKLWNEGTNEEAPPKVCCPCLSIRFVHIGRNFI